MLFPSTSTQWTGDKFWKGLVDRNPFNGPATDYVVTRGKPPQIIPVNPISRSIAHAVIFCRWNSLEKTEDLWTQHQVVVSFGPTFAGVDHGAILGIVKILLAWNGRIYIYMDIYGDIRRSNMPIFTWSFGICIWGLNKSFKQTGRHMFVIFCRCKFVCHDFGEPCHFQRAWKSVAIRFISFLIHVEDWYDVTPLTDSSQYTATYPYNMMVPLLLIY